MELTRKYLDAKTLNKITRLDLRARLVVEGFITGLHRSPYHGFAVEFAQHRPYVPGDEIKHIDWKVWSKTDRYYIKEYEEETNLQCTILLDCSKSMRYGEGTKGRRDEGTKRAGSSPIPAPAPAPGSKTASGFSTSGGGGWSKFDYAATLTACLAHLLQRQSDAVGLITFDRQIRLNLPASAHPSHLKLMLHELEQTQPDHASDASQVFRGLAESIRRRGLVVLVSDLLVDLDALAESLRHLRHRRHEVVVFQVLHSDEIDFPFTDNTQFEGLEVETKLLTEPRALRKAYLEAKDAFLENVRRTCATLGIDYVLLNTGEPLDAALASYLAFRQKTMKAVRRA